MQVRHEGIALDAGDHGSTVKHSLLGGIAGDRSGRDRHGRCHAQGTAGHAQGAPHQMSGLASRTGRRARHISVVTAM